ncbi:MAG: 50S ribosomal protein L4 [Deltaproteobacteria bacterium]|nr:50S ribosomal protein L4 [Deltaproteobacteria bacterium]
MLADVINIEGKKVSEITLNEAIFGAPVKEHLFYEVVKEQLANRRSGTASTKTRAFVSGGGAKPWRQKGTGRARAGSIRSPLWRKGGTVFGPHPRDYSYNVPKKVRKGVLKSALAMRLKEGRLKILDSIVVERPKTKEVLKVLRNLGVDRGLIVDVANPNLELAARNLKDIEVLKVEGLNLYSLLRYNNLIITKAALEKIEGALI